MSGRGAASAAARGGVSVRAVVLLLAAIVAGCAGPRGTAEPPPAATAPDASDAMRRAQVRLDLATAYLERRQYDTALDEVRLALQADPSFAEAHALRALIHAAKGDDVRAEEAFERARQLNPGDGNLLHNHGWFHCQRGRFDAAQQKFAAALALPGYRDAARTQLARGICFGRARDWMAAEGALQRAHELDPGSPYVAYNLAEVLYRRGDFDRARGHVQRLNAMPDAANAQTLWLALRIEHAAGRADAERAIGAQMKSRFPSAPETRAWENGRYDDEVAPE